MADLSPAAQAVLDATVGVRLAAGRRRIAAAALRAAADQVVPVSETPQQSDFSDFSVYQWALEIYAYDDATRCKFLALATELENY